MASAVAEAPSFAARDTRRPRGRARRWLLPLAWTAPGLVWQTVFFLGPLVFLMVITFWTVSAYQLKPAATLANWEKILTAPYFYKAFAYTTAVAIATTVLVSVIAFPAAFAIAFRLGPRLRRLCIAILVAPLFTSYMVRTYAWQIVLSEEGLVNTVLGLAGVPTVRFLGGIFSLLIGLMTLTLPLAILIQTIACLGVDRTLLEAGGNLGASPARTIRFVVIPSIRAGLVLAAATTFVLAFGDYVSPLLLTASNPPTLSILIVDTVKSGSQWPRASVIAVTMMLTLAFVFFLSIRLSYRRESK
jgi:spermidine/putrescine transport system permease protein/putrescine transport system permease protein